MPPRPPVPLRHLPCMRIAARNPPPTQGPAMFSENFSLKKDRLTQAKLFEKHRSESLSKSSFAFPLAPATEPMRPSLHKVEGQRGEPPIPKEVNHIRTQGKSHQGSSEVSRATRVIANAGRSPRRLGFRSTQTTRDTSTCRYVSTASR